MISRWEDSKLLLYFALVVFLLYYIKPIHPETTLYNVFTTILRLSKSTKEPLKDFKYLLVLFPFDHVKIINLGTNWRFHFLLVVFSFNHVKIIHLKPFPQTWKRIHFDIFPNPEVVTYIEVPFFHCSGKFWFIYSFLP